VGSMEVAEGQEGEVREGKIRREGRRGKEIE
jgi:hypothetical protein